ncbi:LLM class flavin-dependent oxidoreductase [Acinetobacter sp. YH16032]|uniref:LLM class flavin-dependent oxidoreductase n=1 Tax=Acinetobacter sp. YH16032 TaxID=2601181 RepID=UPI0015D31C26|nr:LLM class flavin-dependent oxidoreductase [Acinetobacter sp. YH16032]
MSKKLHLAGFTMASHVTHSHSAWRHPESRIDFTRASYYHEIAKTLERGKFDFVFFADMLAFPERFGNSIEASIQKGVQFTASLDPLHVATSIAAVTKYLGVAVTKSVTHFSPFDIARAFGTIDHLSNGRIGWNIVTSLNEAESKNFGHLDILDRSLRYDRAEEFVDLALKLWNSWEADAILADKESGTFADPNKINITGHKTSNFNVQGPLSVPRSPQRRPVFFQAGASDRGRDFAAKWGEAIFEIDPTSEGRKAFYQDLKRRAISHGRNPDQIKIFPAFIPFIGETKEAALAQQKFHNEKADPISGLITLSAHTDHDFSQYHLDEGISNIEVPGSQGLFNLAKRLSDKDNLTIRDIGQLYAQGVLLPQLIGTAEQIADQIEEIFHSEEADGFLISPSYTPGTFIDFVDHVVPILQQRGLHKTEYEGETLRENLGLKDAPYRPTAKNNSDFQQHKQDVA